MNTFERACAAFEKGFLDTRIADSDNAVPNGIAAALREAAVAQAREGRAWQEFPDAAPPHGGIWHVYRQGVGFFHATVCYGSHAPWWVPQRIVDGHDGQGDPIAMCEGDLWSALPDPAAIRARTEEPTDGR